MVAVEPICQRSLVVIFPEANLFGFGGMARYGGELPPKFGACKGRYEATERDAKQEAEAPLESIVHE